VVKVRKLILLYERTILSPCHALDIMHALKALAESHKAWTSQQSLVRFNQANVGNDSVN
jgi:hypothetical protein